MRGKCKIPAEFSAGILGMFKRGSISRIGQNLGLDLLNNGAGNQADDHKDNQQQQADGGENNAGDGHTLPG